MNRRRRLALLLTVGFAAGLGPHVVTQYAAPPPAAAWCLSNGQPRTLELISAGHVVGRESFANSGTCDGDTYYSGRVQDSFTDGSCAYVKLTENYSDAWTQQTSCTTGAWVNYTYDDSDGAFGVSVWTDYTATSWQSSAGA